MAWYKNEALIRFETPCKITLISPSNGGKTTFVKRLLENSRAMFKSDFTKIIYCYGSRWQPIFDELQVTIPNIVFKDGLPTEEEIESYSKHENSTCFVFDDLGTEINSTSKFEKLWTVHSHHFNTTILYLAHNIFQKGPSARTVSLNTDYFILFRNRRDELQIQHFARQIYPNKSRWFMSVYNKATKEPFSYLVVDLHPQSVDSFRLRSHIFANEDTIVYQQ